MTQFAGFDHADVRVNDLAAVEAFYDAFMPLIGLPRKRYAFVDANGEWCDPPQGAATNVVEYYESEPAGRGAHFFGVIEDRAPAPHPTRIAFRLPRDCQWQTFFELLPRIGARHVELSADIAQYPAIFFEDPAGTRLELCWRDR
jgi:catechol 2,3-dioxygenase-like lactoylglutathione lyase family enzyme